MNDLFYPHYDAWTTVYDSQLNYWDSGKLRIVISPGIYEKCGRKVQMPIHVYKLVIYRMDRI